MSLLQTVSRANSLKSESYRIKNSKNPSQVRILNFAGVSLIRLDLRILTSRPRQLHPSVLTGNKWTHLRRVHRFPRKNPQSGSRLFSPDAALNDDSTAISAFVGAMRTGSAALPEIAATRAGVAFCVIGMDGRVTPIAQVGWEVKFQ